MSVNFETTASFLSFVVNGVNWTVLTLSDCRACRCTNRRGSHGQPARSRHALSPAPWGGPTYPDPSPAPPPCRSAAPLPRCPWPPPAPTSPCLHPAALCRWTRTPCTGAWEKPSTSSRPPTVLMLPSSSGIRCVCGVVWCGVMCMCGVGCVVVCVCCVECGVCGVVWSWVLWCCVCGVVWYVVRWVSWCVCCGVVWCWVCCVWCGVCCDVVCGVHWVCRGVVCIVLCVVWCGVWCIECVVMWCVWSLQVCVCESLSLFLRMHLFNCSAPFRKSK